MEHFCLGIDASNLREGGGITHLIELLHAAEPAAHGIECVEVWGDQKTISVLTKKEWLILKTDPLLNSSMPARVYWQRFVLPKEIGRNCDILFVPGGSFRGNFRPFVTMNQNILPFEPKEYQRFGISWMTLKMALLRESQSATFRNANGMIYLTDYAHKVVTKTVKIHQGEWKIIPHGINPSFRFSPRPARQITCYSKASPFRLLYVSNVYPYKHQWNVVEAVHALRQAGFCVALDLVGSAYPPSMLRLQRAIKQADPDGEYIHYHGAIPYDQLAEWYHHADGFVFASSCESFSITLLEAMAAGLPIACSKRGPMPDLLGEAGIYFDPEKPESIAEALSQLVQDHAWREQHAWNAYQRAQDYTWERCAHETFDFIARIARLNAGFTPS